MFAPSVSSEFIISVKPTTANGRFYIYPCNLLYIGKNGNQEV